MKQVFVAQHPTEAHLVKGLLESQGIAAEVRGEALFGARGEAPVTPATLPSVWVLNETEGDAALKVLRDFRRASAGTTTAGQPWVCPKCGETLELQFTTCWQCGTNRPVSGN